MKKLLPVILLVLGAGGGIGAGLALRPTPEPAAEDAVAMADGAEKETADGKSGTEEGAKAEEAPEQTESEYVRMTNQFVIPVIKSEQVSALVVLTLSLEVEAGTKAGVFEHEPKLRDRFLRVLFDHAHIGGFDGDFTSARNMGSLRRALHEVAQVEVGKIITDVLILDIAKQEY